MATRADIDEFKAELKKDVADILAKIKALQDDLANGAPVTDADLTELHQDLSDLTGAPSPPPVTPPIPPAP